MVEEKALNLREDVSKRAFTDCHRHGSISFSDFVNLFGNPREINHIFLKPTSLSDRELTEYCRHFWSYDANCDGKLSIVEFGRMIEGLGMSLKRSGIERAFSIADTNGDGVISFSEFVAAYLNAEKRVLSSKHIKRMFRRHDCKEN